MCINNLETNRRLSVSRLPVSKLPISTAKLNYSLRSIISVGVLVPSVRVHVMASISLENFAMSMLANSMQHDMYAMLSRQTF